MSSEDEEKFSVSKKNRRNPAMSQKMSPEDREELNGGEKNRRNSSVMEEISLGDEEKFCGSKKKRRNPANLKEAKKSKQLKKKRLIIRNLSFQVSEEELRKIFSDFGEVLDVTIPLKKDGKKRGFAFIQFKKTAAQIKAMKALNFKKIHGRPIAIDFAVDKTTYQSRKNSHQKSLDPKDSDKEPLDDTELSSIKSEDEESVCDKNSQESIADEDEEDDEGNAKVKKFLKEFDADKEDDSEDESNSVSSEEEGQEVKDSSMHENSDDEEDDEDNDDDKEADESASVQTRSPKKRRSNDVSEGKTVFVRNVSFKNTEEDLEEVAQEYGETAYCLLCTDRLSGHSKGTAFIKFKSKESAERFIEDSIKEPGLVLDGRRLNCTPALSRDEVTQKQNEPEKVKDRRNLRLLKHGLITYGSKEAEGVSQPDMAKRTQLEMAKKQKLKNVNFFVSDKRLAIHNLPKNINDKDLYRMFKKASPKGAVIKEARVMRDFKKTDAQGVPVSRGFGFVAFTEHEDALKALMELNNNPRIFTQQKRPIVEFSVENKVALLSKERRIEKIKMRNKKKKEEQDDENDETQYEEKSRKPNIQKRKNKISLNKRKPFKSDTESLSETTQNSSRKKASSPKKKKCKKSRKNRFQDAEFQSSLCAVTEKYKEKLNKIY